MDEDSVQAIGQVWVVLVCAHDRVQFQGGFKSNMAIDFLSCKRESFQVYAQNLGRIIDSHLFPGIHQNLAPGGGGGSEREGVD